MQFYSNSTQLSSVGQEQSESQPLFKSFLQADSCAPTLPLFFYYSNYYQQLCELSTNLNSELIINNSLMDRKNASQSHELACQEVMQRECEDHSAASNKNTSQIQERQDSKTIKIKLPKKKGIKADDDDADSYQPDDDYSRDFAIAQASQSKNVPKNYGKAIVIFIQKHESYAKKVLQRFNIDQNEFLKTLEKAKRGLNTIRRLRSLWLDEENPFAKVYRIFTIEYLRKHSLSYIFNSRVENFNKHIKYRFKMVESVKDPRNFTHMKDF